MSQRSRSAFPDAHVSAARAESSMLATWWLVVVFVVLMIAVASRPAFAAPRLAEDGTARGYLLVGLKDAKSEVAFKSTAVALGAKPAGKIRGLNVHVVEVADGSERTMAARLAADPRVAFVEQDRAIAPAATANDPMFGNEWHLSKIGAPAAWDSASGTGVIIAILDTGVDGTHPDLVSQLVPGWNMYDNNADTADVNGHGTAVAGAAAAATNDSIGVASIAPNARLMPVRIADPYAYAMWSTVAAGVTWAADHGARVVNLSYVGASSSSTIQSAANYLRSKGGVMLVAAGNTGGADNTAPNDSMLVVSATDETDSLATFSTYGSFVDLAAPGNNILTTSRGGIYQYWWGTSLATPVAAGVAALVISARPDFTATQIDATLKASATDLGAAGNDPMFGAGRVNAAAAVAAALGTVSTPPAGDSTKPTVSITSPGSGAILSGTITVAVSASDNVGVTRVDWKVDGTVVASSNAAPYAYPWNTTTVANGSHTLTAVAYDAAGNSAASTGVGVSVSNTVARAVDTTPPKVAITSPSANASVSGTVTVKTSASDDSGNAGISQQLAIDGVVVAKASGASLSYSWNTRKTSVGTHTITVTAKDAAGNSATARILVNRK